MSPNLTLLRLALARLGHQKVLAAALALGLASALALASTVPLVQAVAAEVALRTTLNGLGDSRYITVQEFQVHDRATFDSFQAEATRKVQAGLGSTVIPAAEWASLGPLTYSSVNGQAVHLDVQDVRPTAAYYRNMAQHVDVVAGQLQPDRPATGADLPVSLPQLLATSLELKVGDQVCFVFQGRLGSARLPQALVPTNRCVRVAAIVKPSNPDEAYWAGAPPRLVMFFGKDDFYGFTDIYSNNSAIQTGRFFVPDLSRIDARNAGSVAAEIRSVRGYFQVRREGLFSTGVDSAITKLQESQATAAFTIQVVAAALILIALFAVAFAAAHFLDGQARELSVLRGRGWPRERVWLLLMIQLAVLAAVAVPAGLLVAGGAVLLASVLVFGGAAATVHPADLLSALPGLGLALAAGLAVLAIAAALASRRDVLEVRRAASRSGGTPWWRRGNLDLAGVVVAIPLLLESRLRGSGQLRDVTASDDPLSLLLPSAALALLALASLRLLPAAAMLARRFGKGLPESLAAWQLTRQPAQYARLALLLTFAVAIGVFSAVYASTEQRNSLDRAAYAAGADVRATYQLAQQPPPLRDIVRSLPGVRQPSMALRTEGNPGRANLQATLLAVDPSSFGSVAWSRPDLNPESVDQAMRQLVAADHDGLVLPGRPHGISVWVHSTGLSTAMVASLTDAAGHSGQCVLGDLGFSGWKQLTAPLRFGPGGPEYPVRLRSLTVLRHVGDQQSGAIALSELGGEAGVAEGFDKDSGWFGAVVGTDPNLTDLKASSDTPRDDGRATTTIAVDSNLGDLVIRPKLSDQPLPALISGPTLDKLEIGLNQSFPLHVDIHGTTVSAVGRLDHLATLYPGGEDFMVVPLDPLVARMTKDGGSVWPNELWLALDGAPGPVASKLHGSPGVLDVVSRADLQAAGASNPLRHSLDATLAVGFAAALVMAVVGFALHFVSAARGRLAEYAILQANGLSPGMVERSLRVEQAVILGFSLLSGLALGMILAFAVLPAVQLGSAAADVIPPTVVTVEPLTALSALAAVLAGAAVVGWLAGQAAGRFNLLAQLRQIG